MIPLYFHFLKFKSETSISKSEFDVNSFELNIVWCFLIATIEIQYIVYKTWEQREITTRSNSAYCTLREARLRRIHYKEESLETISEREGVDDWIYYFKTEFIFKL